MIIYYNPDCSKCQEAKSILEASRCNFEIRNYLLNPPSVSELKELTRLLGCGPLEITRTKEPLYQEQFAGKKPGEDELYAMLASNPVLIERPIVIEGNRAVVGRPPVLVKDFIEETKNEVSSNH